MRSRGEEVDQIAVGVAKVDRAITPGQRPWRHDVCRRRIVDDDVELEHAVALSHLPLSSRSNIFRAVPDVQVLRDLVEHFDDYDHLTGRLQKKEKAPKQRMGQVEVYSLLEGDAQLSIYGKKLRVSVSTQAALRMADEVLALERALPDW